MRCLAVLACLLTGCGTRIVGPLPQGDGETETSGAGTTSTSGSPLPSTSGPSSATTIDPSDTTSADGSSSEGGGHGFLGDVDPTCGVAPDGTVPRCSMCDPWSQDCPDGDKCNPWANDGGEEWNATICTSIDPDAGGPGDPCTVEGGPVSGHDDCGVGSMCWNVDARTLEGECVAFCQGSASEPVCAEPGTACMIANDGVLVLCVPTCDPLAETPCDDGHSCHPLNEVWFCLPDGSGVTNGPLTPTLCEPGTTAVDPLLLSSCEPDSDLCCAEICDLAAPTCEAPLQCVAVGDTGDAGLCLD